MSKTLQLSFTNAAGKAFSLSLDAPRTDLTGADVTAVMNMIIEKNIFATTGGDVTTKSKASIINKDVVELELL